MGPVEWLILVGCAERDPVFHVSFGPGAAQPDGSTPTVGAAAAAVEVLDPWLSDWTQPTRIARGEDGSVLVSDPRRGRVWVHGAGGQVVRVLHVGGSPLAVGLDAAGRAWVGDRWLRAYDATGQVVVEAGRGELARPSDLVIEPRTGRVYVTDSPADVVRVYEPDGRPAFTFGAAELAFPTGIALGDHEVWVASWSTRQIVRFGLDGRALGSFGVHGEEPGELFAPQGLWVERGRVWVADARVGRVSAFDRAGRYLGLAGSIGRARGQLSVPSDLVFDAGGVMLVASTDTGRVDRFGVDAYVDRGEWQVAPALLARAGSAERAALLDELGPGDGQIQPPRPACPRAAVVDELGPGDGQIRPPRPARGERAGGDWPRRRCAEGVEPETLLVRSAPSGTGDTADTGADAAGCRTAPWGGAGLLLVLALLRRSR